MTLTPRKAGKSMSHTPKLRYVLGDPHQQPLLYRYPPPWRGGSFCPSQDTSDKYSHFTPKGRYTMDIAVPEDTSTIATHGGTAVKIENNQSGCGNNPPDNFVRILHDNGTMGAYLRLMRYSVLITEGRWAQVDTLLVRSGNTDSSSGSYLYFVIQCNAGLALESIPYDSVQSVDSLSNFAIIREPRRAIGAVAVPARLNRA